MGDISAGVLASDPQFPVGVLPSKGASDPLIRHHQCPALLGHLGNELGDLSEPRLGPPLLPTLSIRHALNQTVAEEREVPDLNNSRSSVRIWRESNAANSPNLSASNSRETAEAKYPLNIS